MTEFLINIKPILVVIHALAAAVGLGSVVVTDVLFFGFLKDFKISHKEDRVLRSISRVIWVTLAVIVITGLGLYFSAPLDYLAKSKFILKMIIFAVIIINGAFLNWYLTPHLKKIAFGPVLTEPSFKLRIMRRIAFALGSISFISWLTVFILGSVRSIPITVREGVLGYVAICLVCIMVSQVHANWMKRRRLW